MTRTPRDVMADDGRMDTADLEKAAGERATLLTGCEAVDRGSTLSPFPQTDMVNRVAALKPALTLVAKAKSHHGL